MNKQSYFKDKVVIITGASSGIGRATALKLARLNAKVVIAARNVNKLEILNQEIIANGGQVLSMRTDISVIDDIISMVDKTITRWEKIDILIANAGQYIQKNFISSDIRDFEHSLNINFYGTVNSIKSVLPYMYKRKMGAIVIINSLDSKKGIIGDGPYVAAKSALDGLGDVLRQELYHTGVNLTSVYPGRIDTPMIDHIQVPGISPKIKCDKVVNTVINGIIKKKAVVIVPSIYYPLGALNNLFPRIMDWFYRKLGLEGKTKKADQK